MNVDVRIWAFAAFLVVVAVPAIVVGAQATFCESRRDGAPPSHSKDGLETDFAGGAR